MQCIVKHVNKSNVDGVQVEFTTTCDTFNKLFLSIPEFRRPNNFYGKTPHGCRGIPAAVVGRPHPTQAWRNTAITHKIGNPRPCFDLKN